MSTGPGQVISDGPLFFKPQLLGNQFGNVPINLGLTNAFEMTATAALTVMNPTGFPSGASGPFSVTITQGTNGSNPITFGTAYRLPPSIAFSTTAGAVDTIYCTLLSDATVRVVSVSSNSNAPSLLTNTAITTAGAGTLTASALAGGIIVRSGPTGAYTDTTDTAALILAALSDPAVGETFEVTIKNTTAFNETVAGGSGVTISGLSLIAPNSWVSYSLNVATASTITLTSIEAGPNTARQPVVLQTLGSGVTTGSLPQFAIAGPANKTILKSAATTPGAQLVRTAAQMLADSGCSVGDTIEFRIVQTGAGTLTVTTDGGATVTLVGTMSVATNTFRDFVLKFTAAATATITEVGVGTDS